MGQQQLLLLVLGIVIVGLAVVVGISAFGENREKSSRDALVNDAVRIASDGQAWTLKPGAFGGGNGAPTDVTFEALGYPVTNGTYTNLNGTYAMAGSATSITISGTNTAGTGHVAVSVYGPTPECVVTAVRGSQPGPPSKPTACTAAMDW